jgi:hypothetical protein
MKKKVFAKTKAQVFLFGMLAAALVCGTMLAGCDTGGGGSGGDGDGDPATKAFSVSGYFTKSGTGSDGQVKFDLASNGASASVADQPAGRLRRTAMP